MLKKGKWGKILLCLFIITSGCTSSHKPTKEKLIIWHWMVDRQDAFQKLAKEYEKESGINVEFKLFFPPDIYSQKVIAAARAGTLPDIFGILGEKRTFASFIKAGHILDLTPYMKENDSSWQKIFYPQTLRLVVFKDNNTYNIKPGIYGVPIDTTLLSFIYNRTLFKKAGLDPDTPPQTFEEFINDAKIVKNKLGVDGFVCGWGEGWLLNALATEWAINLMGEKKFLQTIEGKIPYTDSDWIKVFSYFAILREAGILAEGIATMTNKEAEDAFSKEKAAFSFNGSWAVNVYRKLAPNLDYAFFPLPKVSDEFPVKVWGGAGSSFMVNARSFNKEKAVKFLRWLTAREQQKTLIKETNNLPSVKNCEEELPLVLKNLTSEFGSFTHPDIWPKNEHSQVIEVINRGLQQVVMGIKDPEEIAKDIQKIKERIHR